MAVDSGAFPEVSQRLENFFHARLGDAQAIDADAVSLVVAARDAVSGGKRLRAAFARAGWRAVSDPAADEPDALAPVAAALEVFQAAALVHDDIVDNSDTRRGRPSAHRRLEAEHRALGWGGDPAAHGRHAAILLGDLLVAYSDDLLEEGLEEAPAARAAAARAQYALMRSEVTIGQYLDLAAESSGVSAPRPERLERALRVASYKSARYSVQRPLLIGAALAGADAAQEEALTAFGHAIGMAFQLRDDVLGVFGDAALTGKPAGDDIREGKRTVLVALAERDERAARVVADALGDAEASADVIAEAQGAIRDSGALDGVEAMIRDYVEAAEAALKDAPLRTEALGDLRALALRAVERTA